MSDNDRVDGRSREARAQRIESQPGHPPREGRAASEFGERRRRSGADALKQRLFVPLEKLDQQKYNYRWITADPARVYQLTEQDDYEVVPAADLGDVKVSHQLKGGDGDGGQLAQILVRKPRAWFDADKKAETGRLSEEMQALAAGQLPDAEEGALNAKHAYRPKVGIDFDAPEGQFGR